MTGREVRIDGWVDDGTGRITTSVRADGTVPPLHVTSSTSSTAADLGTFVIEDPPTVNLPAMPQDAPRLDVGPDVLVDHPDDFRYPEPEWETVSPPAERREPVWRALVRAGAVGLLIVAAFLTGQATTERGVRPLLPLPLAKVETAAGMARVWPLGSPAERAQHCEWLATPGDTREYALRAWAGHLRSADGGELQEVDPAVVARVLDDACAGRRP